MNITMDYYSILDINKSASPEQIKKSYKKLAKKFHPDVQKTGDAEKFKEISKAYHVLSDVEKKNIYDRFGEKGLEGGMSDFNPSDIFSSFFSNDPHSHFFSNMNFVRKTPNKIVKINLMLEELYLGCTKNIEIPRKVFNNNNLRVIKERLSITIRPGTHINEKIVCKGKADELPDCITGDLVLVIVGGQHEKYNRKNNDLYLKHEISLINSLASEDIYFYHINNKKYKIKNDKILSPYDTLKISNLGMPIKNSNSYGNLFIDIIIKFPAFLDNNCITKIKDIFPKSIDLNNLESNSYNEITNFNIINSTISNNRDYSDDTDSEDNENIRVQQCVHQ